MNTSIKVLKCLRMWKTSTQPANEAYAGEGQFCADVLKFIPDIPNNYNLFYHKEIIFYWTNIWNNIWNNNI